MTGVQTCALPICGELQRAHRRGHPPRDGRVGLLLDKVKRAGAAHNAQAFVPGACALFLAELGLDIVAILLAFVGQDSPSVFPGGDYACCRQLGAAVIRDLAFDQQVAGFPRCAVLSAKVAVLDGAGKLPGVALGVPFFRAPATRSIWNAPSLCLGKSR